LRHGALLRLQMRNPSPVLATFSLDVDVVVVVG